MPAIQGRSDIDGILNGRKAFVGPECVVLDITNRCNERCSGCWLYSPFLKEKPDRELLNREISFEKAKELIDSLAELGTKRIRFTGGGEPFMHPKIMELIAYTKAKRMILGITTNFSLLTKEKVMDLIRLEVDELAISIWAPNEQAYEKTHPNTPSGLFKRIRDNLLILNTNKQKKTFVTLCNVICNLNYLEVEEMFRFALETGANGVYFTLIDILAGTEQLLLNKEQRQIVLKQALKINDIWQELDAGKKIKLDYFHGFISRLNDDGALSGNYDQQKTSQIPCYIGWIFSRILADGSVSPCCRAVKKIMGNINNQAFGDIWFSESYNEFRSKAKNLPKTDPYFSGVGCLKMCDNLMHNEEMHRRISDVIKR